MKFSRYIVGSMMLAGFLSFASCTDELKVDMGTEQTEPVEDDGMVDVTITFNIQDFIDPLTRDGEGSEGNATTKDTYFSEKIKNIDMLVYALRDSTDNVLLQYGKGVDDHFKTDGKINKNAFPALKYYNEDADNNQTIIPVGWNVKDENTAEELYEMDKTISLRVMRGTVFKLTCWAQSSQCSAYDFNDFNVIKVKYQDENGNCFANNDETRDAFCSSTKFSIGQVNATISITLTRPFAQINVGLPMSADDNEEYLDKYNYSQIKLNDVAQYFNLVENRAWSDEYYQTLTSEQKALVDPLFDENDLSEGKLKDTTDATFVYAGLPKWTFDVHNFSDFNEWAGTNKTPETYNSLSMCYVLVPEATYNLGDNGIIQDSASAGENAKVDNGVIAPTLKDVTIFLESFTMDGVKDPTVPAISYPKNSGKIELKVKRNWRTNLLFKDWNTLLGIEKDPEEVIPDDSSDTDSPEIDDNVPGMEETPGIEETPGVDKEPRLDEGNQDDPAIDDNQPSVDEDQSQNQEEVSDPSEENSEIDEEVSNNQEENSGIQEDESQNYDDSQNQEVA